jgi:hypothetical protein
MLRKPLTKMFIPIFNFIYCPFLPIHTRQEYALDKVPDSKNVPQKEDHNNDAKS